MKRTFILLGLLLLILLLFLSVEFADSSGTVEVTVLVRKVVRVTGSDVMANFPVEVLKDNRFFTVVPL